MTMGAGFLRPQPWFFLGNLECGRLRFRGALEDPQADMTNTSDSSSFQIGEDSWRHFWGSLGFSENRVRQEKQKLLQFMALCFSGRFCPVDSDPEKYVFYGGQLLLEVKLQMGHPGDFPPFRGWHTFAGSGVCFGSWYPFRGCKG